MKEVELFNALADILEAGSAKVMPTYKAEYSDYTHPTLTASDVETMKEANKLIAQYPDLDLKSVNLSEKDEDAGLQLAAADRLYEAGRPYDSHSQRRVKGWNTVKDLYNQALRLRRQKSTRLYQRTLVMINSDNPLAEKRAVIKKAGDEVVYDYKSTLTAMLESLPKDARLLGEAINFVEAVQSYATHDEFTAELKVASAYQLCQSVTAQVRGMQSRFKDLRVTGSHDSLAYFRSEYLKIHNALQEVKERLKGLHYFGLSAFETELIGCIAHSFSPSELRTQENFLEKCQWVEAFLKTYEKCRRSPDHFTQLNRTHSGMCDEFIDLLETATRTVFQTTDANADRLSHSKVQKYFQQKGAEHFTSVACKMFPVVADTENAQVASVLQNSASIDVWKQRRDAVTRMLGVNGGHC